ncbi:MAG: 3-oxoacyl-ACP synthase [Thiotrichales bacterium]|nr:MAG: 3-oxoacyl-ACP synthase [Thiotrichales bacterium]
MTRTFARIAGTGSYLPEKILTNADLEKMVDTSDTWITERTGIKQRRIAAEHEDVVSMATIAANNALQAADLAAGDLDLIILATCSQERLFPAAACAIQQQLGATCAAFDVQAVCSGFVYILSIAEKYITSGAANNVLIIGSEVMSRTVDWTDRNTCIVFGDGAGAVVLQANSKNGVLATELGTDGAYKDLLYLDKNSHVYMDGNPIFRYAVKYLGKIAAEFLQKHQKTVTDIDWLVPHQANLRIISATAKKIDLSMDKVIVTVAEHGNTSAASIPLALDVGVRSGKIKRGQTLLLEAFGGGLTWGFALIEY